MTDGNYIHWTSFIGPTLTVIGTLILAVAVLAWDNVREIKKDLKEHLANQMACQKELAEKYVTWDVLNERILDKLDLDRKARWQEFDRHRHADGGKGPPIKV